MTTTTATVKSIDPVRKRLKDGEWCAKGGGDCVGGWDVRIRLNDGTETLLCEGTAPYTLAQAQTAADSARRDEARHKLYSQP
jgi:hypothetical protein